MIKIITSPRYVTNIIRADLLSLEELGGDYSEKIEKKVIFNS